MSSDFKGVYLLARKREIFSGKSTQELLDIDFSDFIGYDYKQMKNVVQRLASTANKRIKAFIDKDMKSSPALYNLWEKGTYDWDIASANNVMLAQLKFSTKGKDLNALRKEYKSLKQFLSAKTSTVKGWQGVQKQTINTMQSKHGITITPEQFDSLWKVYEKLKKTQSFLGLPQYKYETIKMIQTELNASTDIEDVIVKAMSRVNEIYDSVQDRINKRDELSGYAKSGGTGKWKWTKADDSENPFT